MLLGAQPSSPQQLHRAQPPLRTIALNAQAEEAAAAGGEPGAEEAAQERAKAARSAVREVHGAFRVAGSDALSALRALCAFEAAGEDPNFCT